MGEEGEEFDDLEGRASPSSGGPWLPPEDRLWRHPSEIAGLEPGSPGPGRRSLRRRGLPRRWWPMAGAAMAGAVLATGATTAVAATLMSGHPSSQTALSERAGSASDPPSSSIARAPRGATPATDALPVTKGTMAALERRLGPSLVEVDTEGSGGSNQGTGVVFSTNGMIMTAASLVAHESTINVVSSTGQEWSASLVGLDRMTGIAVIRVSSTGLVPAPLGSATGMSRGQWTVAMFSSPSPYGRPTVVEGSVQEVQSTVNLANGNQLADGIEADVPVTADQPGGALLDDNGDVVGIVQGTAQGGHDDLCAVTPIDDASWAASQLVATGQVVRAYLGVVGRDVMPADQASAGTATGVEVTQVTPKSPAANAGLQAGNVITAFNGQQVTTTGRLQYLLDITKPNSSVTLSIVAQQVPQTVHVTLGLEKG